MAAFEYGVAFDLVTPNGTVSFNPGSGDGYYLTDVQVRRDVRAAPDDIPQRDGGIVHRHFFGASFVTVKGYVLAEAGVSTRRSSLDTLRGYLSSLMRPTAAQLVSSCRLKWTPSGASQRMYDAVRLYDFPSPTGSLLKEFEFTLVSPYPYALDVTQTTTNVSTSGSTTINNTGNTAMYPVLKMNGGTVTCTNTTTGEAVVLSGATVSSYAEIDCFNETAYADGSGANLQAKITQASTNYFALQPGNNVLTSTTASTDVLWQAAWV